MSHAIRVPVTAKADDHQSFVLAHDSLIDVPACDEMGEDDGAHGGVCVARRLMKLWFGFKEGSVYMASVRASKELFAEAELLSKLEGLMFLD